MNGIYKHIISIIIATIALIIGESKTDLIELDNSLDIPSTTEIAYYSSNQELGQEEQSQLLSCVTVRTTTPSKRTNNIPKDNFRAGYSKKISNSYLSEYVTYKPTQFYFPFSDANLRLISFGKLII